MSTVSGTLTGTNQDNDVWTLTARDVYGNYTIVTRSRKTGNQSVSSATDITDISLPLKPGTSYSFSFDIMYSTTGLLCGAQFALTYGGTLVGGGYGINLTTIANGTVGDATTTFGTFIGSGATVAGGGPKVARLFGSIVTGGTTGADLVLRAQPTGVGATVSVLANSCGKAEEQ